MKKKLHSHSGFTMTELLTALAVLGLLTLVMVTGMTSSLRVYRQSTALSESQVLSSTLVQAITDELRFARDIDATVENSPSFTSASYGIGATLSANSDGQVTVGGSPLIGSGAYTGFTAAVESKFDSGCFHITLTLAQGGTDLEPILFTVRALNPPPVTPSASQVP